MSEEKHIVIIGGGFGGLSAAQHLADIKNIRITLIDKRNHHLFQPLLYQVASAHLNPSDIAYPIRSALRNQKNATVLLTEAEHIDIAAKKIHHSTGELNYDYVIIAAGARNAYFGKDHWEQFAPGLKSIEEALEIRRRVLLAFEQAELSTHEKERDALLTFIVVGGGPTGVEMAGSIAEMARDALASEFRAIDPLNARIILIEGASRLLGAFQEKLSESALKQLEGLGVECHLGHLIEDMNENGVQLNGEIIPAKTIIWAAGVRGAAIAETLHCPLDRAGRVIVSEDLSIPEHPEIFVIGDLAAAKSDGKEVPGVAQGALQGGKHAARCIKADLNNKQRKAFYYYDKGSMATIGRNKAVADLHWFTLSGFFAWAAWGLIHILFLVSFRSRVFVMWHWIWTYLTFQRGARLITGIQNNKKE